MKKSLLALAVLGTFAGVASAQSSVTIWGVVDLSVNQIKNGTTKTTSMQSNQLNSNRLGFRGEEDLGGGLKAGFWLEGGMSNENGNAGGLTFQRRSTVSLMGGFGEIRLGRDYDPSFWNTVFGDVYGANGLGQGLNLVSNLGSGATTIARTNNSIGYFLPKNLGGLYGQVQTALGQGNPNNKYTGARVGWAGGPVDIAIGYGQTETASTQKFKMANVGGSYDFGAAKIYAFYNQNKWGALKQDVYEVSVGVPLGQGELRASVGHQKTTGGAASSSDLLGAEYVYNLSKRTALYGGAGQIKNKDTAAFTIIGAAGSALGAKSTGYNVGVRHSF